MHIYPKQVDGGWTMSGTYRAIMFSTRQYLILNISDHKHWLFVNAILLLHCNNFHRTIHIYLQSINNFPIPNGVLRCHDRMVVGFKTTHAVNIYHHQSCEFESSTGEVCSIKHYVIKFVSDLRQVGGFLRVLRFHPPIQLTATR
jgi:hypothetical protein